MSHTDHDDPVSADTGGAEPPPKQARPMAGPTLIARSRQSAWPLFVLAPASVLLVWMTAQTWSPSFHAEGGIACPGAVSHPRGHPGPALTPNGADHGGVRGPRVLKPQRA